VGLKSKGTHQLLVYVYNVTLLRNNIDTIKETTETLPDDSKKVGLEANAAKTKAAFTQDTRWLATTVWDTATQRHNTYT
jgi:hypothetical protein